jgi:hypothetical protein
MRVPIPVSLIREMDAAIISGQGGYTTRAEFIVDAIQERVLELAFETEDAGPPPELATALLPEQAQPMAETSLSTAKDAEFASTALPAPSGGNVVERSDYAPPENAVLFGLHNRDYPSLWALSKLATWTGETPISLEEYYTRICEEAWQFGDVLSAIERRAGRKLTALFPTNREKRKSAETAFRSFAIGGLRQTGGSSSTTGPLFEWQVAALTPNDDGKPLIGTTALGRTLLTSVSGMTVHEPHPVSSARAFLAHLSRHAQADWAGLAETLRAIGQDGSTRPQVLHHLSNAWPELSESAISTNATGYLARAREWGLAEPKQTNSLYHLTPLGLEITAAGEPQ